MLGFTRHLVVSPLLALGTTGAALAGMSGTAHAAVAPATIQVSGSLHVRTGPSSTSGVVAKLRNGDRVQIACSVTGQYVRGAVRGTTQWNRLTSGSYISHAYVVAGRIDACAGSPPAAAPAPPPATGPISAASRAQFIRSSVAPARRSQREWKVPASVTIAQAILESGWGRSGLAARHNNYFGMKCFGQGPFANGCHVYRTHECDAAGVCSPTEASFRTYASVGASFRDHGRLLGTAPRYRPAFAHTRNPNQFLAEVHKAGYATSPTYTANVQRVMQSYNLYQYDVR
ncbi:MAG TPA: sporangiospore maturation cell wall hydrolase GsmA [Micromonosporaceae bacterium]|nr:sporangiospore maturation cell wall hydrolase GsmA [Micromonosporaceae bacterium]